MVPALEWNVELKGRAKHLEISFLSMRVISGKSKAGFHFLPHKLYSLRQFSFWQSVSTCGKSHPPAPACALESCLTTSMLVVTVPLPPPLTFFSHL